MPPKILKLTHTVKSNDKPVYYTKEYLHVLDKKHKRINDIKKINNIYYPY